MPGERIGNSNQYLTISGVVSAPAYSWASDNDTGLYRIGANNIGIAANGTKVLDISNTAVTITPATTLSAALTYGGVTLSNAVTGTGSMVLSASPTLTGTLTAAAANFSGVVTFAGSTQVGSAGALGVGAAATASSSLTVNCGITNKIEVMTAGTYNCISLNGVNSGINTMSGIFGGSTGDVGALYIEAPTSISGRIGSSIITTTNTSGLGIGTTPANPLHVYGSFGSSAAIYVQQNPSFAGSAILKLNSAGAGGNVSGVQYNDYFIYRDAAFGGLAFGASTTYASASMILDSSGNLLVGTTSMGTIGSVSGFQITSSGAIGSASTGDSVFSRRSATGTIITFRYGTTDVGSISTNGTTTAYNTTSDYRLKDNVLPMTGGLATVAALKPVTYDWISNGSAGEGFIAHELQAVIPEAVHGEKDAVNEDGSINAQGVDFGKIVPHLVAAIQELTTRLAALENK
jgi:hypothetical protein